MSFAARKCPPGLPEPTARFDPGPVPDSLFQMLRFLRLLFLVILGSMLWVTSWAGRCESLLGIPRQVAADPWFIATLFDAYWGFVTFYVWLAWKEGSAAARVLWFVAVILLGNIAMSVYVLSELFKIRESSQLSEVVTRRNPGSVRLPALLVAASVIVYALACARG